MSKKKKEKSPGKALMIAGYIIIFAVAPISLYVLRLMQRLLDVYWINKVDFIIPLLFIFGSFLLYRGKQIVSRKRAEDMHKDTRPPVVYLRPFKKDESMIKQLFIGADKIKSNEEHLAKAVEPIGPMIAIGKPGEKLPKPGAIRVYSDDDEWQKVIQEWLSKARLVILRPGITEGLWWELEQAVASIDPEKFLILMHGVKRKEYEPFAKLLKERLSIEPPSFKNIKRRGIVSGFLHFNSDWEIQFMPFKKPPFWRRGPYTLLQRTFHYSLEPIFQRLGVDWKPSPYSRFKIITFGFLGLFFLIILLRVYLS